MRWPRRASWIGEHTRPACGSLRSRDDELLWEVRDGGTPSPAPETGALPSNVTATRQDARSTRQASYLWGNRASRLVDKSSGPSRGRLAAASPSGSRQDARRPHSLATGRVRPTGGQDGCATMPALRQRRKTNERTRKFWESWRRASFPLLSSVQDPTGQRRAISLRSLRRCENASPAIASAPPIHVLGSGTADAWTTVSSMSLPVPPV
jgi:hypothetical protein